MNRSVIFIHIFSFRKVCCLLPFDIDIHLPMLGQQPFDSPIQTEAVVPSSARFLLAFCDYTHQKTFLCDIHIADKKYLFQLV